MKARCYNKNVKSYKNYGAKGVKVCDEWKDNYPAFRSWALSNGYSPELEISRFGDKGDYSPDNCSFKTKYENASEASKGKKRSLYTVRRSSLSKSKLNRREYFELIRKAISGKYKARELSEEYNVDRSNIRTMCKLYNKKQNWKRRTKWD